MTIDAVCRVCRTVGETVNADCGHEAHPACCHTQGGYDEPLTVCWTCWHEPLPVSRPGARIP